MVVEHSDNVIDRALHLLQGEANAIAVGVGNLVQQAMAYRYLRLQRVCASRAGDLLQSCWFSYEQSDI